MNINFASMVAGIVVGTIIRGIMLRSDYRIYPSYPHGIITHLSLGFIASFLGGVAIPALASEEYTAATFLALAAQQFREIRSMERETLQNIEESEMVPRGLEYIEAIARIFEARNYLAILVALFTSGVVYFTNNLLLSVLGLFFIIPANKIFMRGRKVGDIAEIKGGEINFLNSDLYVDDVFLMNIGHPQHREIIREKGLGVIIEPKNDNSRATLTNRGQRLAISHDAAGMLGIYKDVDTPQFTPLIRRDLKTGQLGMVIVPIERDMENLIEAIKYVPVLESSIRKPLSSRPGKRAAEKNIQSK
ncbi:YIEGIA family protein [Natranaerofaba carboxydovora]|uniref:YIEGIA family protein n=1 Tax=Natranaerofaba carboxydovora TaxID=2742683 RepID=UPI001F1496FB|nr:YIEGIA family protein [Natranaerofaba carboxydovora]UMZ73888.1 YIEGIA protein [Natranaerofaba carboxydovora]